MGALKLALLAEGVGERGLGELHRLPGDALPDDVLGPGHLLVRRMATSTAPLPEAAVVFVRPLLKRPGRDARGSDLRSIPTLRQLTAWPQAKRAPNGSIVLLDDDDKEGIAATLRSQVASWAHPTLVVAAVPEFEAWLLADHEALTRALRESFDMVPTPDRLGRDEAKERLARLRVQHAPDLNHVLLAKELVQTLDLERAAKRSPSFRQTLDEVRGFIAKLIA